MAMVEIDLYSGRPNPRFPLTAAQAAELLRRLGTLRTISAATAMPGLGYRGLVVSGLAGVTELRIGSGRVARGGAGDVVAHYADPDRSLEQWLLDLAAAALPTELPTGLREQLRQ